MLLCGHFPYFTWLSDYLFRIHTNNSKPRWSYTSFSNPRYCSVLPAIEWFPQSILILFMSCSSICAPWNSTMTSCLWATATQFLKNAGDKQRPSLLLVHATPHCWMPPALRPFSAIFCSLSYGMGIDNGIASQISFESRLKLQSFQRFRFFDRSSSRLNRIFV